MTEVEIGVMCLRVRTAKDTLQTPEAQSKAGTTVSLGASRRNQTRPHPDSRLLASRIMTEYISGVLSP